MILILWRYNRYSQIHSEVRALKNLFLAFGTGNKDGAATIAENV